MQHEEEVHEEEKVVKGVPALSLVIPRNCWNCRDAGHTSQGCSKLRDEATVARNRKEF